MLTASRAMGVAASRGRPLPEVEALRPLYDQGVILRAGQVVMIAGRSGGGKSTLAQWLVAEMNLRTLYFAADMEEDEAIPRLAATLSGRPVAEIREDMRGPALDYYQSEYLDHSQIQYCFQANPSVEDIYLEMDAYVEAWDEYPEVIVIDNLMDVDAGDESYQGVLYIMNEMRGLAKLTGAAVIILAHTRSKDGDNGTMPQPRSDILNKVDQKPQLIMTLGRDGNLFRIAIVKDRNSRAQDPTGKNYVALLWQGDTASFGAIDQDWLRFNGGAL